MRQYKAENIKNIALAGHGGSGKTSLGEALLFFTKSTDRLGKVEEGSTILDHDAEAVRRKTTVSTSLAPIEYQDIKINLIDTPGLLDFESGFYEGFRPAESVLLAVSGKSGVTVGLEKAFRYATKMEKAKMIFVGKLDSESADFFKVYHALKEKFGPSICPIVVPHVVDDNIACYVDILTKKAYTFDEKGNSIHADFPESPQIAKLMAGLYEAVAETDDALMDKFFNNQEFTQEELLLGVHKGTTQGSITPVYCGSSTTLAGIPMLLYGMTRLLPSARDRGEELDIGKDEQVPILVDEAGPLVAYVFKTIADPFVGKISFVKVVSGKLTPDSALKNSRTGENERMGKLIFVFGKKQEDTTLIPAGDIGAITKLSQTITGDTLCDPKLMVMVERIVYPKPPMSMAIVIKNKGDEAKISGALQRLMEEDPTITFRQDSETFQQILGGMGEQHMDVVVSKLKSKFGIEVALISPKIPYRETIRQKIKVQGRHKKQSGGHGQFGDVWIEFEPAEGEGLIFEEKVFGGAVPRNFFPAVEKGLQDAVLKGTLAGYPMVGLKATLVDGSYHPVDSSEMSFKMAATAAYRSGIPQASPALLEPIHKYIFTVPDENTGDIIGEVNKRRGRVLGMLPGEDGMQVIEALVPLAEMVGFTAAIRAMTQGRGYFVSTFSGYELLPPHLEEKVIAEANTVEE